MKSNSKRPIVAIVDDDPIIHQFVCRSLETNCKVFSYMNGSEALAGLPEIQADIVLLDVVMPGMDGFETLRRIKLTPELADLPVIFLTGQSSVQFELRALGLGAVDYINKPFSVELLAKRLDIHLNYLFHRRMLHDYNKVLQQTVSQKVKIIKELQNAIVYTLTDLVEMRDNSTGGHVLRTQGYYHLLLEYLVKHHLYQDELSDIDRVMLMEASQLHDIGKVAIPDSILLKPGRLTPEEFEIMKTHAQIGYDAILRAMELTEEREFLHYAAEMAVSHHEKWNGSGYPNGLVGTAIPLSGRIMAVVDVYDALISERPYKQSIPHAEAVRILLESSGQHFDPILVAAFFDSQEEFEKISRQPNLSHPKIKKEVTV